MKSMAAHIRNSLFQFNKNIILNSASSRGFASAALKSNEKVKKSGNKREWEDREFESKLVAFSAKSGIKFTDFGALLEAFTHVSYSKTSDQSGRINFLGKKILELLTTQYIMEKYPLLPANTCSTIVEAYIGQEGLADVGKSLGVQYVMRWKNNNNATPSANNEGPAAIRSWVVESLVGAIYKDQGAEGVKNFVKTHILSRVVDAKAHYDNYAKLAYPRKLLAELMKSQSKPAPVARLLKESGRQSNSAIFIVGMYSGTEKISEGYGPSLALAELRAARNALVNHYAVELQSVQISADILKEDVSFFEDSLLAEEATKRVD